MVVIYGPGVVVHDSNLSILEVEMDRYLLV